ncbi:hypothetical protein [Schumannella luteola]
MASTAEKTVKRIVRTRGALAALVTALGLVLFVVVSRLLTTLVSFLGYTTTGLYFDVAELLLESLILGVAAILAFAIGYFFGLWFVAPISEELGVGHVITRSVLAVGIGSTVWLVVGGVIAIATTVSFDGGLLGYAFPGLVGVGDVPLALLRTLQDSLQLFVGMLAPGVLAGILLWRWRTAHPPEYHVEGLVDV